MKFVEDLRKINDTAADLVSRNLSSFLPLTKEENIQALLDYCYAVSSKYGEAATELAAQMYDACGAASGLSLKAAEPASTASYDEVARTIRGTLKTTENAEVVGAAIGRLVKMSGVDTTMQNALRDGAEWAWIPHGMTCAYCIMLASRGWTPASKDAIKNGHAEHIHPNCDCTYAVRFTRDSNVAGYRPEEYREIYDNADGRTGRQKLNAMRREFYARNKTVIDNSDLSDDAKRAALNAPAAEEMRA